MILSLLGTAQAAVYCRNGRTAVPYAKLADFLGKKYKEAPTHLGISGTDFIVLFTNKEKGTMTIVTVTKGLACVIIAAEEWHYNVPAENLFDPEL